MRVFVLSWRPTGASETVRVLADEYEAIHERKASNYLRCAGDGEGSGPEVPADGQKQPEPNIAMTELVKDFHRGEPRAALCLSGGGIRSAAFGLGVIQWLAEKRLLEQFHYMSTVSGGGYIGSWLSAWIAKEDGGFETVRDKLTWEKDDQSEPPEIRHLRENATYLTQRTGPLSADLWAAVAISVRNLILNWLVIIPPILGLILVLQALVATLVWAAKPPIPVPTWPFPVAGLILYAVAVQYAGLDRPRWTSIDGGRRMFGWLYMLPLLGAAVFWTIFVGLHPAPIDGYLVGLACSDGKPCWLSGLLRLKEWYLPTVIGVQAAAWLSSVAIWWWVPGRTLVFVSGGTRIEGTHADGLGGPALVYTVKLSRKSNDTVVVDAYTEDRQAVAGIHYADGRQRVVFKPRQTSVTVRVLLRRKLIADTEIEAQDVRLLLRNAQNAEIGRTPHLGSMIGELGAVIASATLTATLLAILHPIVAQAATSSTSAFVCLALPSALLAQIAGGILFVGLSSRWTRSEEDREWQGRSDGILLGSIAVWIFSVAVTLVLPDQILPKMPGLLGYLLGGVGGVSGILGALIGRDAKTPAIGSKPIQAKASALVLPVACALFVVCLLASLSLAADSIIVGKPLLAELEAWISPKKGPTDLFDPLGTAVSLLWRAIALLVFATLAGAFVNVNRFSLHSMYRNRLVRTFLGASHDGHSQGRKDRFTGFSEDDNLEMQRLWDREEPTSKKWRPFHVINIALNVVRGEGLSLKERRAVPFTVTPFWCGAAHLADGRGAFRRSSEYGGGGRTITLGTAMAISGAAVSPNMGYHSSSLVTLLLALFNVRLGWWFGNPADPETYRLEGPRSAMKPLLYEAFGMTDETSSYVYLSDGGHFENLGLYEMVRRRCHFIVVSDAGHDPDCGLWDLSSALARIRIDFGISITFDGLTDVRPRSKDRFEDPKGEAFAVGTINYRTVDGDGARDGIILYVKPSFRGDEPAEVIGYAAKHGEFPHETTLDQWFTEAQFESYRALGSASMDRVLTRSKAKVGATIAELLADSLAASRCVER